MGDVELSSSFSKFNKPKCDKNNLAVWKSWQTGGGVHSVGWILFCSAFKLVSAVACLVNNCDNLVMSSVASLSLLVTDSKVGMDESL